MYFVSWKSSGRLVAYDSKTRRTFDIVNQWASQPIVSPNGKQVMYKTSAQPGYEELWISDIEGKTSVKLASGDVLVTGEWSPDGSQVSYVDSSAGDNKLFTVGIDGSRFRQVSVFNDFVYWVVWSPDGSHYVSTGPEVGLNTWRVSADGARVEKVAEKCAIVSDYVPGGRFLVGFVFAGESPGIYAVSLPDKRCLLLRSETKTSTVRSAPDGRSILYALPGEVETVIYRLSWNDGEVGIPEVAARLPFVLNTYVGGAGHDFSRDLSIFVSARPSDQADLFYLSEIP
jgi:hypothetical protein